MFTKAQLQRLNEYRIFWLQWLTAQPLPLMGGAAAGLLLMVGAIAFSQPWSPPKPELIVPELIVPELTVPELTVTEPNVEPEPSESGDPPPAWDVAMDVLPGAVALPTEPAQRHPQAPSAYDQAMIIGYRAYREQDYQTALINFRRALDEKEGDRHATEAVNNVEAIIQHRRQSNAN